jgi:4-carboxymuconolactone decarboxylase
MRSDAPRIRPLTSEEFSSELQEICQKHHPGISSNFNIIRTLARAPGIMECLLFSTKYMLSRESALPPREREVVILRIGYLCRSAYEVAQHVKFAVNVGLTQGEIERLQQGATDGWDSADLALISVCDEIVADHFVGDETWRRLVEFFSERQAMDIVWTASGYVQICTVLNVFGVQLEDWNDADKDGAIATLVRQLREIR